MSIKHNMDYEKSKEIAENFYEDSFRYWRMAGMSVYQAFQKAEQEVLQLTVNPYTGKGELDTRACKDLVSEMRGVSA